MAITKAKKVEIVKRLAEKIGGAKALAFVNFHGLSVANATALRRSLRAEQVGLVVAKKTLLRRVLSAAGFGGEVPDLTGEIALAYALDPLAPARGVYQFERAHKEAIKLVGGVHEGQYADAKLMLELALIPSREVLLGKLANILQSPIQRFAIALNEVAKLKANA